MSIIVIHHNKTNKNHCLANSEPDMIDNRVFQQHTALRVVQQPQVQLQPFSRRDLSTSDADEVNGKCVQGLRAVAGNV